MHCLNFLIDESQEHSRVIHDSILATFLIEIVEFFAEILAFLFPVLCVASSHLSRRFFGTPHQFALWAEGDS